jgi:hypothetical protein
MGCNVVIHDPACPDFHDHEHVEQSERGRRNHKEVTGHDIFRVISNEGHPVVLWVRRSSRSACRSQVLADSARRDSNAELELEFVGDSGFAPDRVLSRHSEDELSEIIRQPGPATRSGLPPPE